MMRRCIVTSCRVLISSGSRCPQHREQQRAKYGGAWPAISKAAIRAHIALHGWTCPGWKQPAHESDDLTLDHQAGVMCRACNSCKRNVGDL